jgi:hypothetical protein
VKVIEEDDLTSPVGGVRAARACRSGRTVLSAARERGHPRGEKQERCLAGLLEAGTDEAGERPAGAAAHRIAPDVPRAAEVANQFGTDEAIGHPAEQSPSRAEVDGHPAAVAVVPGNPAQPAEEAGSVGRDDQDDRDGLNGQTDRAPPDGRNG